MVKSSKNDVGHGNIAHHDVDGKTLQPAVPGDIVAKIVELGSIALEVEHGKVLLQSVYGGIVAKKEVELGSIAQQVELGKTHEEAVKPSEVHS